MTWQDKHGASQAEAQSYISLEPDLDMERKTVTDIIYSPEWQSYPQKQRVCIFITRFYQAKGDCSHSGLRHLFRALKSITAGVATWEENKNPIYLIKVDLGVFFCFWRVRENRCEGEQETDGIKKQCKLK